VTQFAPRTESGKHILKTILWEYGDSYSLEYFQLGAHDTGFTLEGTIVLLFDKLPARIMYQVVCDTAWRTRTVTIHQEMAGETKQLALEVSESQAWHSGDTVIPFGTGFFDVDLERTPATNTLPLRRVELNEGESMHVDALWVRFPALTLEPLPQRYTNLGNRRYRYESLSSGYTTELEVDELGLVIHYHGLWQSISR
jgi:uncharacterized protein